MKRTFIFLAVLLLAACNLVQASPTALPPSPTTFPSTIDITVYFTNLNNFNVGTEPYEKAVIRTVPATDNVPQAVLLQLFKGPTDEEKAQGLDVFKSGATGFSQLT